PHSDCLWPEAPERLYETINHLSDQQIDKISHANALRFYGYDAIGMLGGRQNCTVGALRAASADVDIAPRSFGGPAPLAAGAKARPVTSGDIMKMMGAVTQADGELADA